MRFDEYALTVITQQDALNLAVEWLKSLIPRHSSAQMDNGISPQVLHGPHSRRLQQQLARDRIFPE